MGNINNINSPSYRSDFKRGILLIAEVKFKAFGQAQVYKVDNYDRSVVGIPCTLLLKDPQIRTQIHHPNLHSALAWEETSLEINGKRIFYFNYSETSLDVIIKTRKQQNKHFPESDILRIARDILLVLAHLQQHGIYLGGIEPSTIFHDKVTNSICMYDTQLILGEHAGYHKLVKYATPEILKALQEGNIEYLEKNKFQSDVFCVGLSLLEMCSFKDPSNLADRKNFFFESNVLSKQIECLEKQYSQKVIALIKGMLEINPNERSTAAELLQFIYQSQIQPQPIVLQEQNHNSVQTKQVYLRSISPIIHDNSQKQQLQTCGVLKTISLLNPPLGIIQNPEQKIQFQPYFSSNSRSISPFSSNPLSHLRNNSQCLILGETRTPRPTSFSFLPNQAIQTPNNLVSAPFRTPKNINNTDFVGIPSPKNTSFISKKINNPRNICNNRFSQLQQQINCQNILNQQYSSKELPVSPPRSLSPVFVIPSNSRSPSISSNPSKITQQIPNISQTLRNFSPQKVILSPPRRISPTITNIPIIYEAKPAPFKLNSVLKPNSPLQAQEQQKHTLLIKQDQQILKKENSIQTLRIPQPQQSQVQHKNYINQNVPFCQPIVHQKLEQILPLNQCLQQNQGFSQHDLRLEQKQQHQHHLGLRISPSPISDSKNHNSSITSLNKSHLVRSPLTKRTNHFMSQPNSFQQNIAHLSNIPQQPSLQQNNNTLINSQLNLLKGQISYQNKSCNASPQSRPYFRVRGTPQQQQQTQKVSPYVSFGNNNNSSTRNSNSSFISPITSDQQVSFVSLKTNQPPGIPISANCSPNKNIPCFSSSFKRLLSPVLTVSNNNTPRTINQLGQQTQKIVQFQGTMSSNINNLFVPAQQSYFPLSQPPTGPLFSITSLQENSIQNQHQSSRNSSASKPSTPKQEKINFCIPVSATTVTAEQLSHNILNNIPHPSVIQEESDQSAFEESLRAGTQALQQNSKYTNSDYSKSNEGFFKYTFNCGEQSPFSNNKQSEATINLPCSFQHEFNYAGNEIQSQSPI